MTLANGKGLTNVMDALILTLSSRMPAAVVTANSSQSAALYTALAGSYVIPSGGRTLLFYNGTTTTPVTVTIAAGTYTAVQLAAALNLDAGFAALWTARAVLSSRHVEIYKTTRSAESTIKIGDGTANSIVGLVNGRIYTWHELRDIALYRAQHEEFDHISVLMATPQITVKGGYDIEPGGEMCEYHAELKIYDTWQQSTGNPTDMLLHNLAMYAELVADIITGTGEGHNLYGAAVNCRIDSVNFDRPIQGDSGIIYGCATLSLTIQVQESLGEA